jgi:hypothetical protein
MKIAFELIFSAQEICRIEEFILRPNTASRQPGTEEYTFSHSAPIQFTEQARKFIGLEGGSSKIASRAEWTIEAVTLTC